jgi:hypothetical protein
MLFQRRSKLIGVGRFAHHRQRFVDVLLGVVDVLERIEQ